jgi:lysophospholipase L1-like esterase
MADKTRILFTGDSITDADRTNLVRGMQEMMAKMGMGRGDPLQREQRINTILGSGYAMLCAAQLGADFPGKYEIINRGIGGNRVVDLDARVKTDCINLEPDVISIMIGINDVWHEVNFKNGVSAAKFERVYDAMLAEIKEALPNVKFILIEPYVLKAGATEEKWEYFETETELRRQITVKLAEKYGAKLLPAQKLFSEAAAKTCATDWSADGVHPTPAGHWMLAKAWLELFLAD